MHGFCLLVFLSEDSQILKRGETNPSSDLGADYTLSSGLLLLLAPNLAVGLQEMVKCVSAQCDYIGH